MYDREVISRSIVSPIGSGATYEEVRDSIIEGFEQKVRSIVVAPFHVELLTELAKKYDNGYTRTAADGCNEQYFFEPNGCHSRLYPRKTNAAEGQESIGSSGNQPHLAQLDGL